MSSSRDLTDVSEAIDLTDVTLVSEDESWWRWLFWWKLMMMVMMMMMMKVDDDDDGDGDNDGEH